MKGLLFSGDEGLFREYGNLMLEEEGNYCMVERLAFPRNQFLKILICIEGAP